MTQRQRSIVEWVLALVSAGLVSAGVAWGSTRAEITAKLDEIRFTTDSVARRGDLLLLNRTLQQIIDSQRETNDRLREIMCPPGSAAGCR